MAKKYTLYDKLLGRKLREQRPNTNQIKLRPERYTLHAINNKIYFLRSVKNRYRGDSENL